MERQLALLNNHAIPIAQKQIDIANAEFEVTRRQVAVAQLQVQHTQQIVSYLQNKFFNKELWYELAREVKNWK